MEIEKLRHLLEHWIEHNEEHISRYIEWAEKIKDIDPELSRVIMESVEFFNRGNERLKRVREMI